VVHKIQDKEKKNNNLNIHKSVQERMAEGGNSEAKKEARRVVKTYRGFKQRAHPGGWSKGCRGGGGGGGKNKVEWIHQIQKTYFI